jgi:hypothetical protein
MSMRDIGEDSCCYMMTGVFFPDWVFFFGLGSAFL